MRGFLRLTVGVPLRPEVREYPLDEANGALLDLNAKGVRGAKVLRVA